MKALECKTLSIKALYVAAAVAMHIKLTTSMSICTLLDPADQGTKSSVGTLKHMQAHTHTHTQNYYCSCFS